MILSLLNIGLYLVYIPGLEDNVFLFPGPDGPGFLDIITGSQITQLRYQRQGKRHRTFGQYRYKTLITVNSFTNSFEQVCTGRGFGYELTVSVNYLVFA